MKKIIILLVIALLSAICLEAQDEARILRFPAIYKDMIVFSKAGDLYTVARTGGIARKLTNHEGYEMFPRYSPDGKYIAFTAQYDGNTEVYIIPAIGGEPRRLTFTATLGRDDVSDRMGPNNIVMTWAPDSKYIVYRSRRFSFNPFIGQLFKVPVNGGLSEEIPLAEGGFCSYSPDGKKLAFNKIFREFRTWKYYKGGMADDIWVYEFETKKTSKICENVNQDIIPMWCGDEIYYISDRERTMNLFCYNTQTKQTTKVTDFKDYDIKFPSTDGSQIVFENAGQLFVFDTKTKKHVKIQVEIANDFIAARPVLKDASSSIRAFDVAPDGNRVLFSARGDIFSVPVKQGITKNISNSSGAHDRDAEWSPDGKYIAYISDRSGEFEIYIQKSDGTEEPVQLTKDADTYYYELKWAPDSKKIMWSDRLFRLRYINTETKEVVLIHKSNVWELRDYNWSFDNNWIVYSELQEGSNFSVVFVYDLSTKEKRPVTQSWYDANSPAFSSDGKYLLFASNRDYKPIYNQAEWNVAYQDMEKIYLIPLDKNTLSPFAPKNDEVKIEEIKDVKKDEPKDKDKKKDEKKEEKKPDKLKIDFDGIQDRVVVLPTASGNYGNIYCIGNNIYYRYTSSVNQYNGIKAFDLENKKENEILAGGIFTISANQKKIMVLKDGRYTVADLANSALTPKDFIDVSNMKVWVNLSKEWQQIYSEAWRQMRDCFYVPNMHGVNWKAIREKYSILVPYVKHRAELTYIIGEMIAELSIGHSYVGGGEKPAPARILTGLLGAKLNRDESGYYKIDKILSGVNWDKARRNPLREIGVNVNEGDFILEVNGQSTKEMNDIYQSLLNTPEKQVEITVNSKPELKGSRKVIVIPTADESELYYYEWIQKNMKKVNEASNDQVGYIHIRDMGNTGLTDFMSAFYPQLNKKALIIDDRGNGGGNVSPIIIERLGREVTRSRMTRNSLERGHIPGAMVLGPKVMLLNEYSASDGDLFPYAFKKHKLGKLIGKRSWGGVVGIREAKPFIDGGIMNIPEFASYSAEKSEWIIEGIGVEPDIVVDNDLAKQYAGEDAQLDKAIQVILEELKNFKDIPPIPDPPDKSK